MCIITLVYTAKELKGLDKASREALRKRGKRLVQTSAAIKKIVIRDPRVNKKLKVLLRSDFSRVKRGAARR
jgi:hypothetical protein